MRTAVPVSSWHPADPSGPSGPQQCVHRCFLWILISIGLFPIYRGCHFQSELLDSFINQQAMISSFFILSISVWNVRRRKKKFKNLKESNPEVQKKGREISDAFSKRRGRKIAICFLPGHHISFLFLTVLFFSLASSIQVKLHYNKLQGQLNYFIVVGFC